MSPGLWRVDSTHIFRRDIYLLPESISCAKEEIWWSFVAQTGRVIVSLEACMTALSAIALSAWKTYHPFHCLVLVLWVKSRASYMKSMCFTTELHPLPIFFYFICFLFT